MQAKMDHNNKVLKNGVTLIKQDHTSFLIKIFFLYQT